MREINGSGEIHPRAEKIYIQEYQHGANLFEKALVQANRSVKQKREFDAVLNMAMEVLNQSAKALKRDDLIKKNQKIEHDFHVYQKEPNKQNLASLKNNLESAKKSLIRK